MSNSAFHGRTCVLLSLALLLHVVLAQRPGFPVTKNQMNTMFFWSADEPISRAINDLAPEVVPHLQLLTDHLVFVEDAILSQFGKVGDDNDAVRVCKSSNAQLDGPAIQRNLGLRGFPAPDTSCLTDVSGERLSRLDNSPHTLEQLYNAVSQRGIILNSVVNDIRPRVINEPFNFTDANFPRNWEYGTNRATCSVDVACGIRVNDSWHMVTRIHNKDKYEQLPRFGRQAFLEYPRVVDGRRLGDSFLMRVPVRGTDIVREDVTTSLISWRGAANPACFKFIQIEQNPAILEALDKSDFSIQQGEDALTPSSIAILVLPLCLNLIPIALLANVNTLTMLAYTLMSDVLTVIPLLIKGIELIVIANERHQSFIVRMATAPQENGSKPEAAVATVWAGECRARENFEGAGIAFVILSLVFLVIGVVLEFVSRAYVKRRRKQLLGSKKYDEVPNGYSKRPSNGTSKSSEGAQTQPAQDDDRE